MQKAIRVPIELELKNMQGAINTLRNALSNVSKNSGISTEINKDLDRVQKKFNELQAVAGRPFTKVSDLNSFQNQLLKLGDSVNIISDKFKGIQFKDIDLSKIQGAEATFNNLQKTLTDAQAKVNNFMNEAFSAKMKDSGFESIVNAFNNILPKGTTLDTSSYEKACDTIKNKLAELIKEKRNVDNELGNLTLKQEQAANKQQTFSKAEQEFRRIQSLSSGQEQQKALEAFKNSQIENAKNAGFGNDVESYLKAYFGIDYKVFQQAKAEKEKIDAEIQKALNSSKRGTLGAKSLQASTDLTKVNDQIQLKEAQQKRVNNNLQVAQTANQTVGGLVDDPKIREGYLKAGEAAQTAAQQVEQFKAQILQTVNATQNAKGAASNFGNAIASTQGQIAQAENKLRMLNEQARKMDQFKSRMAMWFGFTRVMSTVRRVVNTAVTEIRELDKVMTQISVVTKMSQEDLWNQIDAYTAIAKQYGVATRGVYEVSQIYYQQGLQTADVMDLTSETLKMAKIASLDYATAADYMTVAVRGFKMEMSDAQVVTDVYSALAANTASSTEELATAMSKTASSAEAVGSSFESTSAMIATMIATTRESATNIGSAMKSIISRYGEMTSDPTKLVDSEGEEMSLNRVDKALQSIGITLQTTNGQFRDFDDVILELAQKWDTVDRNTQRYIATIMAGNRQQSRFLALVGNYDEYARALDVAANAEDSGTLQTLKTMDSLETKIQGVKTAWEQFYNSMNIEGGMKKGLDIIAKFFNSLSNMSKPAALGTIISLFKGLKTSITGISNGISGTFRIMQGEAQGTIDNLRQRLGLLQEVQNINVDDSDAISKIQNIATQLQALGATNIPINLTTNGTGAPVVTTGGTTSVPAGGTTSNNTTTTPGNYNALIGYLTQNGGKIPSKASFSGGKISISGSAFEHYAKNNFRLSPAEAKAQLAAANNQLSTAGVKDINGAISNLKGTVQETSETVGKSGKTLQQDSANVSSGMQQVQRSFSQTSGYLRVFGGLLQSAGAALTTWAMTQEDKSTDTFEKSKFGMAGGSFLSAAGSGLTSGASTTMMTGNWIVGLIVGIINMIPGLVSAFSNLADAMNFETKERVSLAKKETETAKNESLKKENEAKTLKSSLVELEALEKKQYDSAEAAQEYREAMNNLGEQYPELIAQITSSGDVIIDAYEAEKKLTQSRIEAAEATLEAAEAEYKEKALEKQMFQEGQAVLKNTKLHKEYTAEEAPDYSREANVIDALFNSLLLSEERGAESIYKSLAAAQVNGIISEDTEISSLTQELLMASKADSLDIDREKAIQALKNAFVEDYFEDREEKLTVTDLENIFQSGAVIQTVEAEEGKTSYRQAAHYTDLERTDLTNRETYAEVIDLIEEASDITDMSIEELTGFDEERWDKITGLEYLNNTEDEDNGLKLGDELLAALSNIDKIFQTKISSMDKELELYGRKDASAKMKSYILNNLESFGTEDKQDLIEENVAFYSQLSGRILETFLDTEKYSSIAEWSDTSPEDFKQKQEEIFKNFITFTESEILSLMNYFDNPSNYTTSESYLKGIKSIIGNNKELEEAFKQHFITTNRSSKTRARDRIKQTTNFGKDEARLMSLFGGTSLGGELLAAYGDEVVSAVNLIDNYTEDGLLAKANALKTSVVELYTSLGLQSDEVQNDVLSIVKNIDWESATSIQTAIDAMTEYAKAEDVNLKDGIQALQDARDNLAFNLSTEIEMMTNAIKNGIEGMEKTISSQTKGMGLDDAFSAFRTLSVQDEYKEMDFKDLITYDATLKQWVYTQEGFTGAIKTQTKTIEKSYQAANDAYNDFVEFNNQISVFKTHPHFTTTNSGLIGLQELNTSNWEEENYKTLWSQLGMTDDIFAQDEIKKYLATDRSQTFFEWLDEQVKLNKLLVEQKEAIYEAWGENIINLLSAGIDIEKIMSGTDAGNQKSILQQIILENDYAGKALTDLTEELQNEVKGRVDEIYEAIQEGDLSKLGKEIEITDEMSSAAATTPAELAGNAIEELMSGLNTVLSAETVKYLKKIEDFDPTKYGINVDENGAWIVENAEKSMDLLTELLKVEGKSLEEQNEQLAQVLEYQKGVDDLSDLSDLASKTSLTYSDIASAANALEVNFETYFKGIRSALQFNKFTGEFDIIDFDTYWKSLGYTLEKNTSEYLEAYSEWVDNQLDESNEIKENAQSQLDDVLDAKLGEQINVSYLEALIPNLSSYLGEIKNGVATIGEDTNIVELVQAIAQAEADGKDILENSVGELRDSIIELIQGWADAISSGLTGELTNADAEGLKQQFSFITDADFTETKNGLKLSRDAAFELYTELKKIDSVRAGLAFDAIAESLVEVGSGYEDVAATMKTIANLNKELANVPVSSERRKELERELDVAKEILRVRSQDPDSFNFMDKELPTGMQGPENYWNSIGQAYTAMNEASSSGYMEIQDYYNIVNQMASMIEASGGTLEWMGMNAENASIKAAELIQKGMSALSNVDGEGVKVSLEKLGSSFDLGAEGMADGFADGMKTMAKSQIQMLDAAIRMLEAMVAMENIDADKDGFLGLGEIFANGSDLSDGWDKDVVEWADNLEDAAGKIDIGGKSLLDALATLKPEQIQNALNSLMSIDWTLGDIDVAAQIRNVLSAYFPDVDITQGNSVFDILQIPDDADKNAKHFTEWLNKFDLNVKEYNQIKKALDLNSQISTKNDIFKNIEKMLGLEEGDARFENLYSNLKDLGYGIQDAIKIWDEITVTDEDGKTTYTYNGNSYTSLESVLAARRMSSESGEKVAEVKEVSKDGQIIGYEGKIKIGNVEITAEKIGDNKIIYTSSDGSFKSTNYRDIIDYEVKQKTKDNSTGGIGTVEAYAQYGIDITAEGLSNVSVKSIKETLSSTAISDAVEKAGGTEDIIIPIDGKDITFAAGTTETEIQQKLMEAIGIDASQVETIVSAITTAISTADWSPVGEAIKTALEGSEGEGGLKVAIDSISIDPSKITSATIAEGAAMPEEAITLGQEVRVKANAAKLLEIISLPEKGILSSENEQAGSQTVKLSNKVEVEADASNLAITIPDNLTPEAVGVIERFNEAVKGAQTNGLVQTGVQDNTKINPLVLLEIIALKEALTQIQNNPEVTADIKAEATGTALAVVKDLLAIYGIDGETAELIFNATDQNSSLSSIQDQINTILAGGEVPLTADLDDTEAKKKKNNLTKRETKFIDVKYVEPTLLNPGNMEDPAYYIRTGHGKAYNTTTYSTPFAAQERIDQLEFENGDLTGTFSVELIDLATSQIDATTLTVTPLEGVNLFTDNVNLATGVENNGNKGNSGKTENSQSSGTPIILPPIDTTEMMKSVQDASDSIGVRLSNAGETGGANAATAIQETLDGIKSKTVSVTVDAPSSVSIAAKASLNVEITESGKILKSATIRVDKTKAKGNVALAKGNLSGTALASGSRRTLMGELGPELVVSGGRYYVVGQNGAEFVDLADDAIVFNHLQTQRLLKNGHAGTGKPVTNETKATSLATGNVGPAMASASDALAQLRQIRAMWQALLGASAKDLGSKAGYGGGGGGGGGGGEASKAVLGDLDRWYNLLRQIESLEKHITLEQAKRENMRNGQKYADSLEKELELLRKQQDAYKKLAEYQKRYYDARMQEVNTSQYGEFIFTYDEHGLMQYKESEANADGTIDPTKLRGLDLLAALNETDENGVAKRDAQAQLNLLKEAGFDISVLDTNEDGSKAETAEDKMQNFWDNIDGLMEEMDGIYDSYHDALVDSEENLSKINELLQEYIDNQLSVEQKLLQAIQDREQAEIDRLEKEKELLEEASQSYIDGLNEALSKEREMYDKNQAEEETSKLQRQLAILQRSGGSASEIKSLQDQINSRLKDAYFEEQQSQIDAIQEASDNQIEKLQTQIDIMTETLEYQKENGLLWNEVYNMMQTWTPEAMLAFIEQYTQSYQENSALQNEQDSQETNTELGIYTTGRDREARDAAWNAYYEGLDGYSDEIKEKNKDAAQAAFNEKYATGGLAAAQAAANEVFSNAAAANPGSGSNGGNNDGDQGDTSDEPSPPTTTRQNGSISGGSMNVRSSASSKSKSQGTISSGKGFVAVGYKDGWLKVENANVGGGKTVSGYMKYDGYQKYYRGISVGSLPAFAKGGLVDFTGPAWVDGTKSKPEAFLSASDTAMLKSKIFSNSDGSLKSLVAALEKITNETSNYSSNNSTEQIVIHNAQVNIQPGTISSDYDARRAGELALEEMVKIARKTTNRVVSR